MHGAYRRSMLAATVMSVVAGLVVATPASAAPAQSHQTRVQPSRATLLPTHMPHSLTPAPGSSQGQIGSATTPTPTGLVRATVSGSAAAVQRAVTASGGRVLVRSGNSASVLLPSSKLATVAAAAGVQSAAPSERPYTQSTPPQPGPSQAVATSNANAWQTAGTTGAGVSIAIIDAGFGDNQAQFDGENSAGHLGTSPQVNPGDCTDPNNPTVQTAYPGEPHGLAVAELAHQQAPGAQLFLYCVATPTGVAAAVADLESRGIKIASSSLAWFNDARGDGSGPAGSVAATVAAARKAGVLWINAAGNYGLEHWGASLVDSNRNGIIDMGNASNAESNFYVVAPGSASAPTSIDFNLQWDNWGNTTSYLWLRAYGLQCNAPDGSGGADNCQGTWMTPGSGLAQRSTPANGPVVDLATDGYANTSTYPQVWQVQILTGPAGSYPVGAHYDLFGLGDTYGSSFLACNPDRYGNCQAEPSPAIQNSVISPANSPYAMAVGAVDVGADGTAAGTFEPYSSQGGTIDGRVKPDIAGWDGVSSYVSDYSQGFYGTSATAPEVAGAAALVAQQNPTWDASQIQNFLEQRSNNGGPANPPNNAVGHGILTLGDPATAALPARAQYMPLVTPDRILDTRGTTGGHHAPVGPFGTVTVALPSSVPMDATAVSINLTGVQPTNGTFLAAYPGGASWPGTSNLNLVRAQIAAVSATVSVANHSITVLNAAGSTNVIIDVLGYYAPSGLNGYTAVTPNRVVDTRNNIGGRHTPLGNGDSITVNPGVPGTATAVVVNITSTQGVGGGFLSAAASCTNTTSTLNWTPSTRANLAVVGLDTNGHFCLMNSFGKTQVLVDVLGYMAPGGASYVALPSPARVLDTRTNNGVPAGNSSPKPMSPWGSVFGIQGGIGDIPASTTALVTGVTATNTKHSGWFSVVPSSVTGSPSVSTLNYDAGANVPNASFISLPGTAGSEFRIYNGSPTTSDAIVDVFGYFLP